MITIRPTKVLARRLGITVPLVPPPVSNRVADWCAHEFRFSRYRYLIFCNTASLYPVVMLATGVTDGEKLMMRMLGGLQTCLKGGALEQQFQQQILPAGPALQWAPIPDRSVFGQHQRAGISGEVFLGGTGRRSGRTVPAAGPYADDGDGWKIA